MKDKIKKWSTSDADILDGKTPEVGQWYWITDSDGNRWFACVVNIGSNYVGVEGVPDKYRSTRVDRIHFDNFWEQCEFEPDPDDVINREIQNHQDEVHRLMGRAKEITARLAVTPSPELYSGDETRALALRNTGDQDMAGYKAALVKAKDEELPDIFERIKVENTLLSHWMEAKVIPLKAQAEGMNRVLGTIKDRILSIQLYAGLTEEVVRITDGDPAPLDAKIHLLQRRCYMDEECLARYETGGMDYQNIGDFDEWLARPENLNRILPFPRCIVSFRVRRNRKDREVVNLRDFIRIMEEEEADKWTFLYIRNGSQLFRMSTDLEFGEKLFPDLDKSKLDGGGRLWADTRFSDIKIITENEYQGMIEEYEHEKAAFEAKEAAYEAALKTPEAWARAKKQGKDEPDASCVDVPWPGFGPYSRHTEYELFDKGNVNYDDITEKIAEDIKEHNRIALILQGLLDRSPVLHPHPPWQIWTSEGFQAALELVYDDSRALPAGAKPDFKAYRKRLNASLQTGSVTVGQQDTWERYEAEKESRRMDNDWRHRGEWRPTHHKPYGNPGPGLVARVIGFSKKGQKCSYAWERQRLTASFDNSPIRTSFTCHESQVLNIDAYKPGDFRQFFDDPRSRADYLQWAPLLLVAEEYHADKYEVSEPAPAKPKKPSSWESRRRYRQQKRHQALVGKIVRLVSEVRTKGGKVYAKGSLWKVVGKQRGTFMISGVDESGKRDVERYVTNVSEDEFEVVG